MISPFIPIISIDHFTTLLYVKFFLLLFKPRCAYFWVLSLLGPALARQENIYSGTVRMSVLSGCPYQVSSREKSQRHVIHLIFSINELEGRRVGTMTVAKSQGRETC